MTDKKTRARIDIMIDHPTIRIIVVQDDSIISDSTVHSSNRNVLNGFLKGINCFIRGTILGEQSNEVN